MSVWRRLQRVGKKAAKFEFTFSLQECIIECAKHYNPGNLVVVWSRRSRRHSSKPFKCCQSNENMCVYSHLWEVPDNMVFTTTLYRGEKAIQFEEKEWTCQLEDIGGTGGAVTASRSVSGVGSRSRLFTGASVRRRVLATRQIDLSEFAADVPNQQTLKVCLRLATKHITMANVTVTVNSVIVKEGEATDEDMISLASMQSMCRVGSFNVGSGLTINDVGAFSPPTLPRFASVRFGRLPNSLASASGSIGNFHSGLGEINTRLEKLGCSGADKTGGKTDGTSVDSCDSGQLKSGTAASTAPSARDYRAYAASASTMSLSNTGDSIAGVGKLSKFNARSMTTESSRDLLTWCQDVTKTYAGVHVTNLTTSFQSGLAFCAILHHFFPDNIHYPSQPSRTKAVENCRLAFEVAAKLGIARVLDPMEITSPNRPPDLLSMMTYLHQMRTHCCPPEVNDDGSPGGDPQAAGSVGTTAGPLQTAVLSDSEAAVGEVIGDGVQDVTQKHESAGEQNVTSRNPAADNAQRDTLTTMKNNGRTQKQSNHQPQSMRYDHMLAKAQSMLQETREKKPLDNTPFTDALPPLAAQQRKKARPQSTLIESPGNGAVVDSLFVDPADVTADRYGTGAQYQNDVPANNNQHASTPDLSESQNHHGRSHRNLMRFNSDGTFCVTGTPASTTDRPSQYHPSALRTPPDKTSPVHTSKSPDSGDMRVRRLRLSQLILFAKGRGSGAPVPIRIGEHHLADHSSRERTRGSIDVDDGSPGTRRQDGEMSSKGAANHAYSTGPGASPGQPYSDSHELLQPSPSTADYISNEQAELDRTARELDEEASGVEQRLRLLMNRAPGSAAEEQLLRRWFVLVNKKSAITRRGMQLSIMEKEEDLQKKMRMLQEELREMSKVEEYLKADADRRREELLLRDLVHLVNKRDDLIQELDLHEQGLAEDLRIGLTAEQAISLSRSEKGCILQ